MEKNLVAPTVVNVSRPKDVEEQRMGLPIVMMEQEIMEAINENISVIICGETGCGKTTQVPQVSYIYFKFVLPIFGKEFLWWLIFLLIAIWQISVSLRGWFWIKPFKCPRWHYWRHSTSPSCCTCDCQASGV